MHECVICLKTINLGETYHDGRHRAHTHCVERLSNTETIHILSEGEALCGREGPPNRWPVHHIWIGVNDPISRFVDELLCRTCKSIKEGEAMPAPKAMKRAKITVKVELESGETFDGNAEEVLLSAHHTARQLSETAALSVADLADPVRDAILSHVKKVQR